MPTTFKRHDIVREIKTGKRGIVSWVGASTMVVRYDDGTENQLLFKRYEHFFTLPDEDPIDVAYTL